jgi:hypothetical protein
MYALHPFPDESHVEPFQLSVTPAVHAPPIAFFRMAMVTLTTPTASVAVPLIEPSVV